METRRVRRTSYKQLKLLVKFMVANPCLAKGVDYRTAAGRHYYETKWTELANIMNAQENGLHKSPREWNRYWKDLKCGVRKKVRAMKMRSGHRKIVLNSIEQVIYKNMCQGFNKSPVADDKTRSYLHIGTDSDDDVDNYEVEYLEDSSDEAQMTNITDGGNPLAELAFGNTIHFDSEAVQTNVKQENFLYEDNYLMETLLNNSKSTAEEQSATNRETKNNLRNGGVFLNVKVDSERSLLTDIRDQVKELVQIQKERARSAQRMAAAHERRAILEEKRVKIEERRLKIEERRVALEERKMEAAEKRSFAGERLATAAERRNDLEERRIDDGK